MATTTTIPVRIEPGAATRIEELGMRPELDRMLDFLKNNVPGLSAITVDEDVEANRCDEATLIITTHQPDPGPGPDPSYWSWVEWFVDNFPADVCRHFARMTVYEAPNGR